MASLPGLARLYPKYLGTFFGRVGVASALQQKGVYRCERQGFLCLNTLKVNACGDLSTASGQTNTGNVYIGGYRMGYRLCVEPGTVYA